ncbi:ammonia-dependent NAD(+) synthetase [Gordonia terrae]|uniref:ammonia-dependent NAD(+) synthetase n=1 Tax=Gordonia terrae TaxID=2055 RepID=UPI003F6B762E
MREIQRDIIDALRVKPTIDPADEVERRVAFLVDYLRASGAKGYVLGLSGGVDSTLAGRLAQLAAEKVRADGGDAVFVGVRLPYRVQHDEDDAAAAVDFVAADEVLTINVAPGVDALNDEIAQATGAALTDFTKGNAKARHRMVAQYAVAGDRGLLVIGADHASENVTGFFTKFGDGAADILPLSGLNKRQGRSLLRHLGAPAQLAEKVPTADLLDEKAGQTDEDELGLRYDDIDDYLEGRDVPVEAAEKIEATWVRNRHKRTTPVEVSDTWWRSAQTHSAQTH